MERIATDFGEGSRIRERFTVNGPTLRVTGMWARIGREGSTKLDIAIKAGGATLMQTSVAATVFEQGCGFDLNACSTPVGWKYVKFPSTALLEAGKEYSIEL